MNREIVNIDTLIGYTYFEEPPEGWLFMDCIFKDYDSEKGSSTYDLILQRESDNKYFKIEYQEWPAGQDTLGEENLYEVFPEIITTVIYK